MSKFFTLFFSGGTLYYALEILWRGYSHWSMFFLGGLCLYLLFLTFSSLSSASLIIKAIIGGSIITAAEFFTGCIVNLALGWNVWSYSSAPFNLFGQICPLYSLLWTILSFPIALFFKHIEKYIG